MSQDRIPQFLSAKNVAAFLDVKVATLAKWRRLGTGPQGWRYATDTLVLYPRAKVLEFIAAMPTEATPSAASLSNLKMRRAR